MLCRARLWKKKLSLHCLPSDPNARKEWMNSIFNKVPDFVSKILVLFSLNFTMDLFTNEAQFNAGFPRPKLSRPLTDVDCSPITPRWQGLKEQKMSSKATSPPMSQTCPFGICKGAPNIGHWKVEESFILWENFNLDAPDGFQCYWHDKEIPLEMFSTRHSSGSSFMIWTPLQHHNYETLDFL